MKICLAILTTGTRPETLKACLESITRLEIPCDVNFEVLVVENNKSSSIDVCRLLDSLSNEANTKINQTIEPEKGIPFGRNCALRYAQFNAFTHLAFVDDDAFVDSNWLISLLNRMKERNCQAVAGPQKPLFPPGTKPIYSNATVYKELPWVDGQTCKWAATNNVLFDVNFALDNGLLFSEDMRTGGSDKEFFTRYSNSGGKIIWTSDAVVTEFVEPERIDFRWAIKRTFRFGGTGYRIEKADKSSIHAAVICVLKAAYYTFKGTLKLFTTIFIKDKSFLDSICDISHGVAFFLSIFTRGKLNKYT